MKYLRLALLPLVAVLSACGGASGPDGRGPAVGTQPQTIQFGAAPQLMLGSGNQVAAHATASSGLPVRYGSGSPSVCGVDAASGAITVLTAGTCSVLAMQPGDATWAAAPTATLALPVTAASQSIGFAAAPALTVGSVTSVQANASSGLPVRYASLTPAICSVDAASGHVTALAAGACTVAADQPGDAYWPPAPTATLAIPVAAAGTARPPAAPRQVNATAADGGSVLVSAAQVDAGGSPVMQYVARSVPAAVQAQGDSLPVRVICPPAGCAGYAFTLQAVSAAGAGAVSPAADVVTGYDVVVQFKEPDYAYDMTEFHGSFRYNATRKSVSGLQGQLSEVMAGNNRPGAAWPDGMPLLSLGYQLSSIAAPARAGEGLLVTSFLLNQTATLSADPRDGGTDGFTPGTGGWKYWGYDGGTRAAPNPGNAYVRIFVNTADPAVPLTQAQIDTLAYADCAAEGMMGDDCMTGTTEAGYGTIGSMRGYPVTQRVTRR